MSDSINCLRCRHAQTLPHSDFALALRIRGGKVEINRDVIVPIFCGKTGRNRPAHLFETCDVADPRPAFIRERKIGGDRAKKFNPVARAFLIAVYPTWPKSLWSELCAALDRTPDVVVLMSNRWGVIRETTVDEMRVRMERANITKSARGSRMNAVPKDWRQIIQHIHSMSPAAKRKDRAKENLEMSQFIYRKATAWTDARAKMRRDSQFKARLVQTRDLLEAELEMLKAKDAVVEVMAREFLRDGKPRESSVWYSGVVLSFESKNGPLRFSTDQFHFWQNNLRGIALGLESLRKIDRYGISQGNEQYQGYAALPPQSVASDAPFPTREAAIVWMGQMSGIVLNEKTPDTPALCKAYRVLARRLHPDAPGGDAADFRRLQHAKELLKV